MRTFTITALALGLASSSLAFAGPANASESSSRRAGQESAPSSRLFGDDRYATAVAISAATFSPGVPVAYVVTGEKAADALAATALAGAAGGPVLLTRGLALPDETRAELVRLAPGRVVVLGGTAAVAESVLTAIRVALPQAVVRRDAGATRYETAVEASRQVITTTGGVVYVASGLGFTEVLAASVLAARDRAPVLLVPGSGPSAALPLSVAVELARLAPRSVRIVGGSNLVAPAVEKQIAQFAPGAVITRITGDDGYGAASTAAMSGTAGGPVWVATGDVFADGLGAGAAAAKAGASLVMVPRSGPLPASVQQALATLSPSSVTVVGGEAAVSAATSATLNVYRRDFVTFFLDPLVQSLPEVDMVRLALLRTAGRYGMRAGSKVMLYSKDSAGVDWVVAKMNEQRCMNGMPRQYIAEGEGVGDSNTGCGFIMRMGVGQYGVCPLCKDSLVTASHEMFHVYQGQRLRSCSCPGRFYAKMPRWFLEGTADFAGYTVTFGETPEVLAGLKKKYGASGRGGKLDIGFEKMDEVLFRPYTSDIPVQYIYDRSFMAVAYLVELTSVETVMGEMFDRTVAAGNFDSAFQQTFGMTEKEFEAKFTAWIATQ